MSYLVKEHESQAKRGHIRNRADMFVVELCFYCLVCCKSIKVI